ncbi:arsenosugar biosynthesis radical SAM (seleno)protein ArsS [Acidobacteriota bacterium]
MNSFETRLQKDYGLDLYTSEIRIIQANIGFKCNLSCKHCHLACGPDRKEMMDWETMTHVICVAKEIKPEYVDITGGSPEINPYFKELIIELRKAGLTVQVRTNLTVLLEPGMETIPQFLRNEKVHLVASMPCYLEENVRIQRGNGVYQKSIQALQMLNSLGYGKKQELPLNLVYNPAGPFLPPNQTHLESDYKRELYNRFGIHFTSLFTITNMPIGRFWKALKSTAKATEYMRLLSNNFNSQTVEELMCRHQICISWDGSLYDCDFNLALRLPFDEGLPENIKDLNRKHLSKRKIRTGDHCFGCTAGLGSSCGGAISSDLT